LDSDGSASGEIWSPNDTRFAFLDVGSRTVYVMNADGGGRYAVHLGGPQYVPERQPHPDDEDD
jgi:hypothetical protein